MKRMLAGGAMTVGLLWAASAAADGPPPPTTAFDGAWLVTLTCPNSADGRANGFTFEFDATVKAGQLHGVRGAPDQPGWMTLDGQIQADGSASMLAEGLTNSPTYALYGVQRGTHFRHPVTAKFDGAHGAGHWITIRTCDFDFQKQ